MKMKIQIFSMLIAISFFASAQRPFDLYKTIIDKNPFGPPPADPTVLPEKASRGSAYGDVDRETAKEIQQLEKTVTVSAIVQQPSGKVMVGFSDSSNASSCKHYYLAVGETKDGWAVVSADVLTKKVLLEKDSIQIERVLGEKAQAATPNGAAASLPNAAEASRPSLLSGASPRPLLLGGAGGTMRSRRQRRLDEEAAALAREQARKASEEVAAQQRSKDEAERAELRQSLMDLKDEIKRREERSAAGDSKNDIRVEPNQDGSN